MLSGVIVLVLIVVTVSYWMMSHWTEMNVFGYRSWVDVLRQIVGFL